MKSFIVLLFSLLIISACNTFGKRDTNKSTKIRLIIDTDANNELDDQHALAYALYNRDIFDIEVLPLIIQEMGME
jgi:hypothetical protein